MVLTKTRNDLKRHEMTYNEQETTYNDLQRARNDLKRPKTSKTQPTMTWAYLQRAKKRREMTKNKQIFRLLYNMGKRFFSLTRFPPNIWLQSFEHCFTENHDENKVLSIYYHASSVNYHMYFLRNIRFIFFCLGFVSAGKERGYYFSSSLLLSTVSQIVLFSALAFIGEA